MAIYKAYEGIDTDVMPSILRRKEVPLSVAEFMRDRQAIIEELEEDIRVRTSDLAIFSPMPGILKIVLTTDNKGRLSKGGRTLLGRINPSNSCHGLITPAGLTEEMYRKVDFDGVIDFSLSRQVMEEIRKVYPEKKEIMSSQLWRILLRHPDEVPKQFAYDKGFMNEVVNRTLRTIKLYNCSPFHMAVGISTLGTDCHIGKNVYEVSEWRIGSLIKDGSLATVGRGDHSYSFITKK